MSSILEEAVRPTRRQEASHKPAARLIPAGSAPIVVDAQLHGFILDGKTTLFCPPVSIEDRS